MIKKVKQVSSLLKEISVLPFDVLVRIVASVDFQGLHKTFDEIKFKIYTDAFCDILRRSKFISKPNQWFVEGTEVKLLEDSLWGYDDNSKFKDGYGLFSGVTMNFANTIVNSEEACPYEEFNIYDENGFEISDLTLKEYFQLIK
jgi:hypothetical protein